MSNCYKVLHALRMAEATDVSFACQHGGGEAGYENGLKRAQGIRRLLDAELKCGHVTCSVAYVEHMTLAEQVKLYSQAQILVMTHGASIGNIIFMSPVSNWSPTP